MREFIEYACIVINFGTDLEELENHLNMNGYNFGIDKSKNRLFVHIEELDYVETILEDRDIVYAVMDY